MDLHSVTLVDFNKSDGLRVIGMKGSTPVHFTNSVLKVLLASLC